jgi:hypothetical protein
MAAPEDLATLMALSPLVGPSSSLPTCFCTGQEVSH